MHLTIVRETNKQAKRSTINSYSVRLNGPGCYQGMDFMGAGDRKWESLREFFGTHSCSKCGHAPNNKPCEHKRLAAMVRASGLQASIVHKFELPASPKAKQASRRHLTAPLAPAKLATTAYCTGYGQIPIE